MTRVFRGRSLQIERLEDRCVLSVATVNTPLDVVNFSDGVTSLREAVFFTNALIGHDTIQFDSSLNGQSIVLTQGELTITDSLEINGPGVSYLTIDASGSDPTPDTNNGDGSRIFSIDNGNSQTLIDVSISGLTLTGGDVGLYGGAILSQEALSLERSTVVGNSAALEGGGISSRGGTLSIAHSTIRDNTAASVGGGVVGIGDSMSIVDSTFSGNASLASDGGGLYSSNNTLTVSNSTFSGNTAHLSGGGIYVQPRVSGTATIAHSTVTNNHAQYAGGISSNLDNFGTASIDHTIVAGNTKLTSGRDDISGTLDARYSLIGDNTGATIVDNGGNQIGTSAAPINAMLGLLADNGGPTFTHALLPASPAVDAGDPLAVAGVNAPSFDQRGTPFGRVKNGKGVGARIDIGAYEIQSGSIHGYKWNDLDGDGVWDQPNEPALSGWIVFLDTNNNGALESGESWTVTDATGAYSFDELPPANYTVAEVMLPGWTQTEPGGPQVTSLVTNGGFEAGSLTGWTVSGFVINNGTVDTASPDGPLPPYDGSFSALSTGNTSSLYQTVTLPSGSEPLTLRWAHRIRNHYTAYDTSQQARVEIRNTANQVLATIFTTNPGDPLLQDWTEHSADLSAFAGQTIRIAFVGQSSRFYLNLHVDDVRITVGRDIGEIPVTVAEGQVVNDINFGNWIVPTGEIHGFKWNDLNGNGVWDHPAEPGIANWTIFLDANNNGGLDAGEKWTTTAADGSYSFTGLPAGDYNVSELVEPGWMQTSPGPINPPLIVNGGFETGTFTGWTQSPSTSFVINNGTVDPPGTDTPLPPYQGNFSALSTILGTGAMYQDVAIPANSHLTLHWADRIRNNYTSFTDPSQEYRVEIRNTANQVLATVFSTNPGDPLIREWTERSADLSAFAGQTIRIAFSKSASPSYLNVHVDNVRITNDRPVAPISVSLDVGEVVGGINFGNWIPPLAEIHGYKWNDLNGNRQWDHPTEPPLQGTIVYLDLNANGALEFGEPWTTTGADGSYAFTDLAAGDYLVSEVVPPGWTPTYPGNDVVQTGPDRLFAVRGTGTALTIYELNPTTGAAIHNFVAPVTAAAGVGGQGLALAPHSLFFIDGGNSTLAHTLWELNPDTGAVIDSDVIDSTNAGPIDGLAYLNGKVYIEKPNTNQIIVWDPVADTTVATFTVGVDLIGGLTGAADLGVLFAVNSTGSLIRIDPNSGAVLSFLAPTEGYVGIGLAYINGQLIAARSGTTGGAFRINPVTGAVMGTMTLGGTGSVSALGGDGANFLATKNAQQVTLAANQVVNNVNFGNWIAPPGEIHGFKWNDLDGDGVWDQPQESPLAGWLIFLDANTNGVLDNGERWTTTAADGSYAFTGLAAGEYFVAELMQPGWNQSYPNEVHHDFERLFELRGTGSAATIYELDPATGIASHAFSAPFTLSVGSQGLAVGPTSLFYIDGSSSGTHTLYELNPDTGAVIDSDIVDASLAGTIDGLAYLNGKVYIQKPTLDRILVWDPVSDTLVTTLTVSADLAGGLTGATDLGLLFGSRSNGNIFAINPADGAIFATYTPAINTPIGLAYVNGQLIAVRSGTFGTAYRIDPLTGNVVGTFTSGGTGTVGALGGDGVASVSRGTHVVDIAPGQSATSINFGNWIAPPAQIHGFAWNDLDNDGIWDQPGEPGVGGWTVFLDNNGNGVLNAGEASTTTAADGSYSFTGLAPGPYNIAEIVQTGWARTFSLPFVALDAGENAVNINFGNHALPGSISGQKWNDLDGDGVKDQSEPGLGDWTIFVDQNSNGMLDDGELWTTTNSDGSYFFNNIEVGSYTVAEVQQSGWAATFTPPVVVVTPALNVINVDFGNKALPGSIHGQKWNDLDGDGVKDQGEPGLQGWTIFIDSNENGLLDTGEQSTTTDANGNYALTGLAPGEYLVAEVQQPGWEATTPTTFVLSRLLSELNSNNAAISAKVPNRYDFLDGATGFSIVDGGANMYDDGNYVSTDFAGGFPYTNGSISSSGSEFGPGSEYFTAKYPGLFVLAADGTSTSSFRINGNTGADNNGSVDRDILYTTVDGRPYTILVRRVYGAGTPSVNHIIIVPGNNAGISHTDDSNTDSDYHMAFGLQTGDQVYYLLVSSANGGYIANAAVLNIASTFLSNVATANVAGTTRVEIGPGQNVSNIDLGNIALPALPGDYNHNGMVDQGDFVLWRKTLGNVVARYSGADGDGDGVVDQDDFEIWLAHVGETLAASGAGSLAESITAAPSNESASVEISPRSSLRMNQTPAPREATGDEQAASQRKNHLPDLVPACSPFAHGRPAVRGRLGAELSPAASRRDEALMAWLASQPATDQQSDAFDADEIWKAEDANDSDGSHIDSVEQVFLTALRDRQSSDSRRSSSPRRPPQN